MATNEETLKSLEALNNILKVLQDIPVEYLPKGLADEIDRAEAKTGDSFKGIRYSFSLHIGQQKRQIAWTSEGKQIHKSIKVE